VGRVGDHDVERTEQAGDSAAERAGSAREHNHGSICRAIHRPHDTHPASGVTRRRAAPGESIRGFASGRTT
jgi:hypothetical protein